MKLLLTLVVALVVCNPASARWYQVEVVVFRHDSALSRGAEEADTRTAPLDLSNVVELGLNDPDPALPGQLQAFRALPVSTMRLAGVAQRLRNSSSYAPLATAAWRQPSFGVVGAKRVYLSDNPGTSAQRSPSPEPGIRLPPAGLEGIVSIKVARLLHIEVDFLYQHEGQIARLSETRNAKLREIHYFDHPVFGVIVQVSPYVVPEVPDTSAVAVDEPADTIEDAKASE